MKKWLAILMSMILLFSCFSPLALAVEAEGEQLPEQTELPSDPTDAPPAADPEPAASQEPAESPSAPETPEPAENQAESAEAAAEPETYQSGDVFTVTLLFPVLSSNASCDPVTVTLTVQQADGSTQEWAHTSIQPVPGGQASASFALDGVPKSAQLRATATAYGSARLSYAYNKQLNATAAVADNYAFICTNSQLACTIQVELLADDEPTQTLEADEPIIVNNDDQNPAGDPNPNNNGDQNPAGDPNPNNNGDQNPAGDPNPNNNGDQNPADDPNPNNNGGQNPADDPNAANDGEEVVPTTSLKVQKVWLYRDTDVSVSGGPAILDSAQITVTLQRSTDQEATWEAVTSADGNPVQAVLTRANGWTATFSDLPVQLDGGNPLTYRAVEASAADWYAAGIPVVKDGICILTNVITLSDAQVMIDNITQNPVRAATNVGGYVAVAGDSWQYDISGYATGKNAVSWKNELNWAHRDTFTVSYQETGSADWKAVSCSVGDISALKQVSYFQYASLAQSSKDGVTTYTLTLAPNAADLPLYTKVEVGFAATLAVENTTYKNRGGQVGIDYWDDSYSGRSTNLYASGYASSGYIVRKNYLQIGEPGEVNGQYNKNSQSIRIRDTGDFKVYVTTVLAGERVDVPITGSVVVYKRDSYGNPIHVCYRFDSLPIPLDVGVPFRTYDSNYGPQTGDPMPFVAGLMGVSGILLFVLRDDKRKKLAK